MTRRHEPGDLRMTNDRAATRRKRMAQYRQRTQPVRDQVRARWFLRPLVQSGAVR